MKSALKMAAEFMALSARTAPKTAGKDYIEIKIIDDDEELKELGKQMEAYGEKHGKRNYDRDGRGIISCGAVLLVSIKDAKTGGLNCGACGYDKCVEALDFHHINPQEKDGVLSRYSRRVFSPATKELIDREVEKCEVLCANCHREEHSKRNS